MKSRQMLLVTNLLIMCPSPEEPIILKKQSQKKLSTESEKQNT